MKIILAFLAVFALAVALVSQPAARLEVGPLAEGGYLLNSGSKLQPAGRQVALDTLPMSSAATTDGRFLLVLNGGYKPPSISVLDVAGEKEIERVSVADAWLGLAIAPDGKTVYAGGGSRARVYEFTLSREGKLARGREFAIVPEESRTYRDFTGDVAVSPDGRLIYAADLFHDSIAVINPQSGRVIERYKTGRRPYRILFHPDGKSFFVSSWADAAVYHHDALNGRQLGVVRVGPHATDMAWSARKPDAAEGEEGEKPAYAARLFVATANTNSVAVLGVTEAKDLKLVETINVALTARMPAGMTPTAVGFSADQKRLYVACSDANTVAVADISQTRSRVLGFIPSGWYPTAVRAVADGRLFIFNGKGLRSYPNPNGPSPVRRPSVSHGGTVAVEYVGRLQTGTASVIPPFDDDTLAAWTKAVRSNIPYRDDLLDRVETGAGNPVPAHPGDPSPIQHVLYIVKENRTYDQVLGKLGKGNGDPSLEIFTPDSTPNHRKLAGEFVLFDNFYVNSDVSADGHNWATAAIAPDYVQKMWPNSYAGRRKHYDYEGGEPAATPPAGYIWNNVLAAGISMRNYGYFVTNKTSAAPFGEDQIDGIRDPALIPVTNRKYRGFDLDYLDIDRAKTFLADLAQFESSGKMPKFMILRLGNDHTSGTAAGKIAPLSAMADNDWALGLIVEGLSKSRFWPNTAIFVVEDDAQNGADHVDSHRSPAFVISPYTRRGIIDSTLYNQTAVLRTIELLLGLKPMTHFDAGARPMSAAFSATPNTARYEAVKPQRALDERNAAGTPTAARSARLDFSEADRIDDDELNDILWRALRGSEPPPPVRSYFGR